MKRSFYIAGLISFILLFSACADEKKNQNSNNIQTEQNLENAPKEQTKDQNSFVLQDIDGENILVKKTDKGFIFSNAKNKVVLVNFFATWCPPCKAEIPHLNNLQEKYKDKLLIIGVLMEKNKEREDIVNFINNHDIKYKVVVSEENFNFAKLIGGVQSIPFMIMYDKNGDYFTHYLGAIPEEMIDSDIQKVLK